MPKVSVIVPVYNVEEYLIECLNSIINQTLKDIEIICIDDGSTDNSGKILDEYCIKDNRIKVIHKINEGYGKAMNVGIDNAIGEYIGIVEPDDYVKINMYENLYQIAKEKNLDLIKADFYRFTGENGNLELVYNKLDKSEKYYNRIINPKIDQTPFQFIMNTWSGIYNREFLKKNNIRHNETPGASFQDNGFWFQTFIFAERIYFLNKPYYMNRRDNPNSSVKNKEKVYACKNEYDFIYDILEKHPNLKEIFLKEFYKAKFSNYIFNLKRIDERYHKEFLEHFSKEFKTAVKTKEISQDLFDDNRSRLFIFLLKNPNKLLRKILKKPSFIEKIFSIRNNLETGCKKIMIFGLLFEIKSKKLEQKLLNKREEYYKKDWDNEIARKDIVSKK